ncbi:hypothetical protein F53441_3274 [Fusarium austroafricanum]|uniref:3-beta hydroxysteroid dehydrogenase/isomerase domain-containing protein n=1 Tax=Fusarium austroafricanum TaxID=2364996 RepID=A0A8H4KS54_9HYPO|nr:hypothetical protein F53441_3274 [Fusarium austroafricanum]
MSHNVLVTGAAGYIGGSLIADILSRTDETLKVVNIFAAARNQDQVEKISKLERVQAFQVDLQDKAAVEKAIDEYEILQSSVASMFTAEGGWPHGKVKDTEPLIERQRELGFDNPVRKTNIVLADEGKAQDVETFNIPIPQTYGRGTGECRKLSVNIPALVRTSIKLKTVYKFDQNSTPGGVHISDLTNLYVLILNKILKQEPIAVGNDGYFFAIAHSFSWWNVMNKIAERLHARGLVNEPTPKTWPSYDMAADCLGFPRQYIVPMTMSNGGPAPENGPQVGWKPKWNNEQQLLDIIDQEIRDVQELDTVKMGLFDSLISEKTQ